MKNWAGSKPYLPLKTAFGFGEMVWGGIGQVRKPSLISINRKPHPGCIIMEETGERYYFITIGIKDGLKTPMAKTCYWNNNQRTLFY